MTEPRGRNLPQNAIFHAMCGDVARQREFAGRKRSANQWKILFSSAHRGVAGEDSDLVAGLEGEFVQLRESTARMSSARMSSLIEYVLCWCAENNITLRK